MKTILVSTVILAFITIFCTAEPLGVEVQITFRSASGDVLSPPKLTTVDGQHAKTSISTDHIVNETYQLPSGIFLDITPKIAGDRIHAQGLFTLREAIQSEDQKDSGIFDFKTREILFKVDLRSGETKKLILSDGSSVEITLGTTKE